MIEVKVNSLDEALQKSYPPWVRRTIEIPDISIYRAFSDSVEKNRNNIAIDFMGKKITRYNRLVGNSPVPDINGSNIICFSL